MKFKSYIPVAMLAALSLTSCESEPDIIGKDGYNAVFTTSINPVTTVYVKNNTTDAVGYVQAGLAAKSDVDVTVKFGVAPWKVADYNAIYSDNAEILPSTYYLIAHPDAVIPAGGNKTDQVEVKFQSLNTLDMDKVYVLPVSITEAPFETLTNNTYYFVVREASLITVVANMANNYAVFETGNQADALGALTQMTVEGLFNPDKFPNLIATFMGIEGNVLLRFGDAGVEPNQLQFATSNGNVTDPAWQIEEGKWSAVSLTFDSATGAVDVYINGIKKGATQYSNYREAVNWNTASGDISDGPRGFYIGYSYDGNRYFDGALCEMRVWNRVLSAEEIAAPYHAYYVANDAPGLVAYWKFDEGAGKTIHDYANGYNLVCKDAPEWISISLPEKN